jgi:hypothetical protein
MMNKTKAFFQNQALFFIRCLHWLVFSFVAEFAHRQTPTVLPTFPGPEMPSPSYFEPRCLASPQPGLPSAEPCFVYYHFACFLLGSLKGISPGAQTLRPFFATLVITLRDASTRRHF